MNDQNSYGGLFGDPSFSTNPLKQKARKKRKASLSPAERFEKFFSTHKPQSVIKTRIVASYYSRWADVMILKNKAEQLGYIDLFCGPGIYADEYESTPIQILKVTFAKPELSKRLVATFNDQEPDFVESLRKTVSELPGIKKLKHQPDFWHEKVSQQFIDKYEQMKMHPTLAFLDPCGYKGLSVRLMKAVLKDFGCDLIFFFNYNRVNMHSENSVMDENIDALFGKEWASRLKTILDEEQNSSAARREEIILDILKKALKEKGGNYFLPFRFKEGNKTSHHIILVSKHYKAYEIMKDVMKNHSIQDEDGIPFFEFNSKPALSKQYNINLGVQLSIYDPPPPPIKTRLQLLCNYIYREFKGKTLTVKQVFERHNIDTPYILKNYKDAIRILEEKKFVKCARPAEERRKHKVEKAVNGKIVEVDQVTVADELTVTFV